MNQGGQVSSVETEKALFKELNELQLLNDKLLQALKERRNEAFPSLLDKRSDLSQKLEDLSRQRNLDENEMSNETKMLAAKVLMQDKELMIYLEMEVQKLKGKYCKLQMLAQKGKSAI